MREIQWAERYRTGISFIDAQHQDLFRIVARLQEAMAGGRDEAALRELLDELVDRLGSHFRDEEDFLRRVDYPDLLEHAAEHAALLGEITAIQDRYRHAQAPLASMIGTFLGGWLRHHISEGDFRFADFLRRAEPTA